MFEVRKVNKDGSVSRRKVSKANTFTTSEEAFAKVKELDGDWVVVPINFDDTPKTLAEAGLTTFEDYCAVADAEEKGLLKLEAPTPYGMARFTRDQPKTVDPFFLSDAKHVLSLNRTEREAIRAGKLVFFGGPSWRRAIWQGGGWKARACTPEEWEMIR